VVCAFGRSVEGVDFGSIDGEPVHVVFLEVSPPDPASAKSHLKALQRVCEILRDETICRFLRQAEGVEEVRELLLEADEGLQA
jgi:PTS system fructose-specific IIA component/PTS system nitrogen regulatory IIA component